MWWESISALFGFRNLCRTRVVTSKVIIWLLMTSDVSFVSLHSLYRALARNIHLGRWRFSRKSLVLMFFLGEPAVSIFFLRVPPNYYFFIWKLLVPIYFSWWTSCTVDAERTTIMIWLVGEISEWFLFPENPFCIIIFFFSGEGPLKFFSQFPPSPR